MNDSQASLIELADQLFAAWWGLPLHLRGENLSGVVVEQCLEIFAPGATPEARHNALWAALEHQDEEMGIWI